MKEQWERSMPGRARWLAVGGLLAATVVSGAVARETLWAAPDGGGKSGAAIAAGNGGPLSVAGRLDRTAVRIGGDPIVRMELVLGGRAPDGSPAVRVPTDLVVILDRSGSMAGAKLDYAKAAVQELIGRLQPQDRFGLVAYSNAAWVAIPLAGIGDGAGAGWRATVDGIGAGGGTNIAAGLDLGQGMVETARRSGRMPRVILISDGLANEGDTSHDGLVERGRRAARAEYMLTTVGVGGDFNEYLMTALADAGTGNYYYLRHASDLESVFAGELDGARATVASGLEVTIEPGAGVRVVDAAGYPLERRGDTVSFRPGSLFDGQRRSVWLTFAVPNASVGEDEVGRVSVAYTAGGVRTALPLAGEFRVARVSDEAEMLRRLDVSAWAQGVVVDGYNRMKDEVARAVKAGERDDALGAISRYRRLVGEMNARVQAPPVQATLDSLPALEQHVTRGFAGPDQARVRNEISKELSAGAHDERRAGAKR